MEFYGFTLSDNTVIEQVYSLDNELLSYFLQFKRPDYPSDMYIKFSPNSEELLEYYPYYICDLKTSIDILTGKETYSMEKFGDVFAYSFAFMSYDGDNEPTQIYDGHAAQNLIYRYDDGKLNRKYLIVYNKELSVMLDTINFSDNVKDFIRSKDPNYVILYLDMNKKVLRYILGFEKTHSKYNEIIQENNIPFFKNS